MLLAKHEEPVANVSSSAGNSAVTIRCRHRRKVASTLPPEIRIRVSISPGPGRAVNRNVRRAGSPSYAAGLRKALTPKHDVGLETRGTFEKHGYSELLIGYYGEWSQRRSFNAGIGTRVDEGPDHAAHMTFIWRFK
jgi:hypothetical protein